VLNTQSQPDFSESGEPSAPCLLCAGGVAICGRDRAFFYDSHRGARISSHTQHNSAIDQNSASSVAIKIVGGFLKDREEKNPIAQPAAALFIYKTAPHVTNK
jgi:hypothetical protein